MVYGTTAVPICDTTGTEVAAQGKCVRLVYPMKKENNKTLMRMVLVDAVTAQLSYTWVPVFEMVDGKPQRNIIDFSPFSNYSSEGNHILSVET